MTEEPAVTLHSAVKRHRDGASAFELRVPDFGVGRGEVCAICGASGCGKTTFLDALGCMSPFDACGRFLLAGRNMAGAGAVARLQVRARSIGYIQQQGGLIPFLSAGENIKLPLQIGTCGAEPDRVEYLAGRLGIAELLDKLPSTLSVGQRQRVSIVRALIHRPAVVLADEPTGALDPVNAAEVCRLLVQYAKEQGTAVIIVTHDKGLFCPMADTVYGFRLNGAADAVVSVMERMPAGKEAPAC